MVNEKQKTIDDKQDTKSVQRLKVNDNVKTLKVIDEPLTPVAP